MEGHGVCIGGRYGDVGCTWSREYGCVGYSVVHRDGGHESVGREKVGGWELWGVLVAGLGGGHGGVGSVQSMWWMGGRGFESWRVEVKGEGAREAGRGRAHRAPWQEGSS